MDRSAEGPRARAAPSGPRVGPVRSSPGRAGTPSRRGSDRTRPVAAAAARAGRPSPGAASPSPRQHNRGHWGRRILAVLALAAIGFALYAINATFQPFHGAADGPVRVKIPTGADAGQIGDILEAKGVVDSTPLLRPQRHDHRPPRRHAARQLHAAEGDEQRRRDRRADKGPKVKVVPTTNVTIPEGPSIREEAPKIDKASFTGSYVKAANSPATLKAIRKLGAPKGTKTAEGFMFPATYTLLEGAPVRPREQAARRLQGQLPQRRHVVRPAQEPHALRRADDRLAGRARGAARQGAPADRLGDLQPPARGDAARDRRHDPLPHQQLAAADPRLRAQRRQRLQLAPAPRPAADPDRQPRP